MRDELVRRNYAATTIQTYLHALDTCRRQHPGRRLDRLGPRELRRYQAYLFEERKLAIGCTPQKFRPARIPIEAAGTRNTFQLVQRRLPWIQDSEQSVNNSLPNTKEHQVSGGR